MFHMKRKSTWFALFSLLLALALALPLAPVTGIAHAQDGDGEDDPVVTVAVEGEVQFIGDDYVVVDGYVVYPDSTFSLDDVSVGDTVSVEGELNEDGTVMATSFELVEEGEEAEAPEVGDEVTIVGEIQISDDEIRVGDYILAPAGSFNPSRLQDGDLVSVSGTLLDNEDGDGLTIKVSSLTVLLDSGEDEDADEEDEDEDEDEDEEDLEGCDREGHPVGTQLADEFDVEYSTITDWRCAGFGYGEIARALLLAEATGEDADAILARRSDGEGWGQIMRDYDIHPSELAPGRVIGGPPEGKGPPWLRGLRGDDDDDRRGGGPPPWAGPPGGDGPPGQRGR